MKLHLKYLCDESGEREAVVIPIEEWHALEKKMQQTKAKLDLLIGIRQSVKEVNAMQAGKIKSKSLKEFLDEF